jgi:uncharacterized protein YlxW (UPF0749 family)
VYHYAERRRRFAHVQTTFGKKEQELNAHIAELQKSANAGSASERSRLDEAEGESAKLRMVRGGVCLSWLFEFTRRRRELRHTSLGIS